MKVKDLIAKLALIDPDYDIWLDFEWEGCCRMEGLYVENGAVFLADYRQSDGVYEKE